MQILPETCSRMYKVEIFWELDTLDSHSVHFGIIEGLVTSLCQAPN